MSNDIFIEFLHIEIVLFMLFSTATHAADKDHCSQMGKIVNESTHNNCKISF